MEQNRFRMVFLSGSCFLLLNLCQLITAGIKNNFISNGDFETSKVNGQEPLGWELSKNITWEQEQGNHFLRFKNANEQETISLVYKVYIKEHADVLRLKHKVRYQIKTGKSSSYDGRVLINFKGKKDKILSSTYLGNFKGEQIEWMTREKILIVPEGTHYLELIPSLTRTKLAQLDFDDFELSPVDVTNNRVAKEAKQQMAIAKMALAAALVKPQVPVADPNNYPDELVVSGNVLISKRTGKAVWLQGVAVSSMEMKATGDEILKTIDVAINTWKSNCVRLALKETFYRGVGPHQNDGGAEYRQLVEDAINYCADRGVYMVLDLHRFRAPTQDHLEFWVKVADRYKNNPAVIFDLFNETHSISWEVWRNGGLVDDQHKPKSDVAIENKEDLKREYCVGMQPLLDAVRKTGARNVAIIGGLDWGYDLSGLLKGYEISDPKGNGIVYSSHVYPWKENWQGMFMNIAKKHPLFIGEVGCQTGVMPWQKNTEAPETWAPDMIGIIQDLKLNWTAWCFHPNSAPRAILDWSYTPTSYWGVYVKDALAGKIFPRGELR